MLRMSAATLAGLFFTFLIFGGELSQEEKASLDALRAERTSITAVLSEAFNPSTERKGGYVPTLAELKASDNMPTLASFEPASVQPASYKPTTNLIATTVADPAKLSALIAAPTAAAQDQGNVQNGDMVLKSVTASRVNVRSGPSTNNAVLGSVVNAEIVRVISEPQDGWVKIIVEGDGVEGYMAARFLADLAQ